MSIYGQKYGPTVYGLNDDGDPYGTAKYGLSLYDYYKIIETVLNENYVMLPISVPIIDGLSYGSMSSPFCYYDEAGRYYETIKGRIHVSNSTANIINIPDEKYPRKINNVANRFVR